MKYILIILAVILFQPFFAQEVLVPFRVKDKWGLSDIEGKMIVNAQYDGIDVSNRFANGYFGFRKGETIGILRNKKELISGKFKDVSVVENKFIVVDAADDINRPAFKSEEERLEYRKRRNARFIYNLSGKNIHSEGFKYAKVFDSLGVSKKYKGNAKYLLFFVENFNEESSVFAYDVDKQNIAEWVLKDFYELKKMYEEVSLIHSVFYLKGRKSISDKEMRYTISMDNNKIKVESTVVERLAKNGLGSGYGGPEYSGDLAVDRADVSIPGENNRTVSASIKVKENSIMLKTTEYPRKSNSIEGIVEKEIKLPYELQWVKEENLSTTFKSKSRISISSVAYYKTKGNKYGIVFLDTLIIKPSYDFIMPYRTSYKEEGLNFMVGVQDSESKKIKYGTIDINEKIIIPIAYDTLFFDKGKYKNFVHYGPAKWDVMKDGKYGRISNDSKTILETVYDSIYKNTGGYVGYNDSEFYVLKKDNKYGLYREFFKQETLKIEPVFSKPPRYYINNYQGKKGFMLVDIGNDDDKFFCYARPDGFLYYKE